MSPRANGEIGPAMEWFPFYVDRFMDGTDLFTNDEVGLYVRLLCKSWNMGALPLSEIKLAMIGRTTVPTLRKLWPSVGEKFERSGDGWINPKMEEVRAEQSAKLAAKSERGSKGAAARWQKEAASNAKRAAQANSTSNAQASSKQSLADGDLELEREEEDQDQEQRAWRATFPQAAVENPKFLEKLAHVVLSEAEGPMEMGDAVDQLKSLCAQKTKNDPHPVRYDGDRATKAMKSAMHQAAIRSGQSRRRA